MVPQIKKILFATDLSENSRRAFFYADTIANRHGAGMVMLHVIEKVPSGAKQTIDLILGEEVTQRFREAREKHVKDVLIGKRRDDDVIRRALADFYGPTEMTSSFDALEVVLREGSVDEEIVKVADEYQCDLVVLGSHKGLLGGKTLGSAAKGVLHGSKIPVLIVPPSEAG